MTMRPLMDYLCDRCNAQSATQLENKARLPEGWCQLRIGEDPSTPPAHLCTECVKLFNAFMQGPRA